MADQKSHTPRQLLNRDAIKTLGIIIMTALIGIIMLSLWGLTLRYGLLSANPEEAGAAGVADEALSILGNIAAAAVGGLVGWLTRDYAESVKATTGFQEMPTDASVTPPPAKEVAAVAAPAVTDIPEDYTPANSLAEDSTVIIEEVPVPDDVEPFNAADDVVEDDQTTALGAPDHPDELDDEEDPDLTWDDEPKKVKD